MNLAIVVTARKYLKWHTIGAGAHTDIDLADATDIGEGDGKVAFPLAALMAGGNAGSGVASSVYSFTREYLASRENSRYWADYQRNTGVTVRYPFKAGYYYDYSRMLGAVNNGFKSADWGYYQYRHR